MARNSVCCCILLAVCLLVPLRAFGVDKSFIEYSLLSSSDTLRNVNVLGFYTVFNYQRNYAYYGGLEFALFEQETAIESELVARVTIGIGGLNSFAPYAEIGIGLFDFLFRSNDTQQRCDEELDCDPDIHFRAGMRVRVSNQVSLGLFYEGVSFGDFEDELSGSHGYIGSSIGIRF